MKFDRRLLGWGTFFILLGAIPLAVRLDYLDPALITRWWSLWPLLLIGWGIGLVLRDTTIDWLGGVVTTVTFGIMGGSLIATGFSGVPFSVACGSGEGQPFAEQRGTLASRSDVSIELPCGQLTVAAVDGSGWSVSGTAGKSGTPVVDGKGDALEIHGPDDVSFGEQGRPVWHVELPREPELGALGVTLNAGEGTLNLDGLHAASVSFTLNAGELSVNAREIAGLDRVDGTVNAGSAAVTLPASIVSSYTVNAGSLAICVPEGAAVRVESTSTLGSNNLDELDLESAGDNLWQTAGYASASDKVELSVTTNAGSFELAFGGGCSA